MAELVLPQLTSLADIPKKISEIVAWTVAHPVEDHIYYFPAPENDRSIGKLVELRNQIGYVAGSAALERYLDLPRSAHSRNWKATDVDLFFVNQGFYNRYSGGLIDIVQVEDKTIEELLESFDLPVCRVAHNFAMDFWVSIQALAAIHTRRQNVPLYLKDRPTFIETLKKHVTYEDEKDETKHAVLYTRFADRIKKYQTRRYGVNWIETDIIIPWVKKRFHYGEWDKNEAATENPS